MEEKNLFIASLACSLIGTLLILFVTGNMEVPLSEISALDRSMLDLEAKVAGTITSIRETDGLFILTIKDGTGSIPVVVFKQGQEKFNKGSKVEATGKITEFQKEVQITAKQIITI